MSEKRRIAFIDVARVVAIVSVVLCHAIELEYYYVCVKQQAVSTLNWCFQSSLHTFGRFGVPFFLMITGALMLGREYDIKKFYKQTFLPLLITTELWTIINYLFVCWQKSQEFVLKDLLYDMLFVKSSQLNHMWYMPMILGLYLVLPFLAKAVRGTSFAQIALPLFVGFTAFSLLPCFNAFAGEIFPTLKDTDLVLNVGFLGTVYGVVMILGYYIVKEEIFKKIPAICVLLLSAVCFAMNLVCARYFYTHQLKHSFLFVGYNSPFIMLSAIFAFELFRRLPIEKCGKGISLLSNGAFAIYLTHNLALIVSDDRLKAIPAFAQSHIVVKTAIRFAFSLIVPLILIFIVDKLPFKKIKKTLFYMR